MIAIFCRFFAFSGNHRRTWLWATLLETLRGMAGAAQIIPLFMILTALAKSELTSRMAALAFGIIVVAVVVETILHYIGYKLEMKASYLMLDDKRLEIGDRLRYMPMGFFNRKSLGQLTAVCTTTMEDLEALSGAIVVRILTGVIHAVIVSAGFMIIDWRIGLIFLAGVLALIAATAWSVGISRRHSGERVAAQVQLVDAVIEFIQGISVVKAFNLVGRSETAVEQAIDEAERQNTILEGKSILPTIVQQVVLRFAAVGAVIAAIIFYVQGSMELEVALLVVVGGFLVYSKLEMAAALSYMLPSIDVAIDNVEEVLTAPTLPDGKATASADSSVPAIELVNAKFSYPAEDGAPARTVINDVSLTIPAGASCALVGPSGSGKTTLVNLMARYWDVDAGQVLVQGCDVREWDYDALMGQISMVFQNVYLFNDTIAANIAFGRPDASREEIEAAARAARCHEFIAALPDGYDTVVGEGGATLSGGERQRISIARALLKDAPIVVLDEATASVDPENEADVIAALQELTAGKTVVMIAHRLQTVQKADQIAVVDGGRIVQVGTHDELRQIPGIYRDFVEIRKAAASWRV